jgi:hypothetical protein
MSKYHDDRTRASDSVAVGLSEARLRRLQPELFGWRAWFTGVGWGDRRLGARQAREMIAEHLRFGDSRAAVVVKTIPTLLVAAYTDEQDAVLLLQFPQSLAEEHHLRSGSRLLTVNTYAGGQRMAPDIVEGPASTGRWSNFYPLIADFLSDDSQLIARRKDSIAEVEWQRAARFADALLRQEKVSFRDGRPLQSRIPATPFRRQ